MPVAMTVMHMLASAYVVAVIELHVCMDCPAASELRAEFADKIPFHDGMRAVMCCADQKALAQFLFKLHAVLERTHDHAVADIACKVCGDLGDEAHMLICSGRAWLPHVLPRPTSFHIT
jgi:hypothetical protein